MGWPISLSSLDWNLKRRFSGAAGLRFVFLVASYSFICIASLWFAYQLRFDFAVPAATREDMLLVFIWVIPIKLLLIELFRQFDPVLSFYSTPDLFKIFFALASASVAMLIVYFLLGTDFAPPRGVILADLFLSFGGISTMRLFIRIYGQQSQIRQDEDESHVRRVGIIGSEDAAANLVKELFYRPSLKRKPVAFFDSDSRRHGLRIHDLPILGSPEMLLDEAVRARIDEVVIAMPGAPAKRIREVIAILQQAKLKFTTIPSVHQLATGEVRVSQLRAVGVEDLLESEPVETSGEAIKACIHDSVVLVTGAGGSIGAELCRRILVERPDKLLLLEQCEVQLFQIEQELIQLGHGAKILPLVGNILDPARMEAVFRQHQPNVVFHAAAHKQAAMMEQQPGEALKNNVFGTLHLARLAQAHRVSRFIFTSSDSALKPSDVMGAGKRLAELCLQALQQRQPDGTRFISVRFGNALGSAGSYIDTFSRQIANGGPVRISHPDAVRQLVSIPETCSLLLECAARGDPGDVLYLDNGQAMPIRDLARQMIELSGLQPDIDLQIEFTGLRPGSNVTEVFRPNDSQAGKTHHNKILRLRFTENEIPDLEKVDRFIAELRKMLYQGDPSQIKLRIQRFIPEYTPYID